nr:coiled-coil domain-containing protein 32-like [Lytechinus pictus]
MESDDQSRNDVAFGKISEEERENHELSFEDDFSPVNSNTSSYNKQNQEREAWQADGYLQSLETKLQRLRGKTSTGQASNKKITSRDILRTLDEARQDSARHLISSDSAHDFYDGDCDASGDTQVAALKRRMFPEQALSAEELQELLMRDFLQAVTQEAAEEQADDETSGSR